METFYPEWNMRLKLSFHGDLSRSQLGSVWSIPYKASKDTDVQTEGRWHNKQPNEKVNAGGSVSQIWYLGHATAISPFPFVFQLIGKLLMSMFTFSPVVLPKCETGRGEGFVLCPRPQLSLLLSPSHSPSCQAPSTLLNLSSSSHHHTPWGSLCLAQASSPTTCSALLTLTLLSSFCCHLFCFEGGGAEEVLGLYPSTRLQNWEQAQILFAPISVLRSKAPVGKCSSIL